VLGELLVIYPTINLIELELIDQVDLQ
jgi:hypothetical protein